MHIGNILKNSADNSVLGAVVYTYPNKLIIFRNINGLQPGIFKMPVEDLNNPTIISTGTINQPEFEPIKKALLKYYRRSTLPDSEKAVFSRIIEYAFPNGVPLFDEHAERMSDDTTRAIRLADHLQPGKCLYINTVQSGPFGHLDNQCIYVLGGDEHGVWVCPHQTGADFTTSYLPFKDRTVPKFWSVNRLLPGEVTNNKGAEYVGRFLVSKTQNGLASQINHTDTRIKLTHDPSTGHATVITPHKWAGQSYDFATGTIKPLLSTTNPRHNVTHTHLTTSTSNDNEPYIGPVLSPTPKQLDDTQCHNNYSTTTTTTNTDDHAKLARTILSELNENDLEYRDKFERIGPNTALLFHRQRGGGSSDDIADAWAGLNTHTFLNPNASDDKQDETDPTNRKRLSSNSSNSSNDSSRDTDTNTNQAYRNSDDDDGSETSETKMFNEDDLEFLDDDEPIIELEQVQKIRQMPVPELDKVFKESVQKGHIYKQKIEKIPSLLRDNPYYKNRIAKDVNVISLLKAQMTTENHMVLAQPIDYNPVIESMIRNDYTNHFLVPLVITTKKLYLTKKDPINRDDLAGPTALVEADFHKYMHDWCTQNARGGMRKLIDINENITRIMTDAVPHLPATMSQLGLMIRFGEGIRASDIRNRDTTIKLKTTRAHEDIQYLAQTTQAIRFGTGGREFQLRNFAVDNQPFDSHVILGPIGNYSNIHKTEYTVSEIEAIEEEVDKNITTIGSIYNIAYMGDNVNLVGFVRPPIMNFLQGRGENMPSLSNELSAAEDNGQIIIKYLNDGEKLDDTSGESFENPDKFIIYLFQDPGANTESGPTLTDGILREYLGRIVPKFDDIIQLFTNTYRVEQPGDLERLVEILYKFDYIVPHREGLSLAASRTQPYTHLRPKSITNWENAKTVQNVEDRIVKAMITYNNKMDKIHKLHVIRNNKDKERDDLKTAHNKQIKLAPGNDKQLITPGLIELADKIYGEHYVDIMGTSEYAGLDENKIDYYAHQPDRAQYMNLLLRKTSLSRLQDILNISELESSLAVLKAKYEASGRALPADLATRITPDTLNKMQLGKCAASDGNGGGVGGHKPRILRYPSLVRMKEDNAKTATTPAGDLVLEGDYAVVDEASTNGVINKLIFRRETLNDGDFWIGQPISVLEQLIYKKRATCAAVATNSSSTIPTQHELDVARSAMRLPEEQLSGTESDPDKTKQLQLGKNGEPTSECLFDVARLQCLPIDIVDMDRELADIYTRIMDVNGQLAFARALPSLLAECDKLIAGVEKNIRNYNHGITLAEKYYTALVAQQQKELEALIKRRRDCPHFQVVQYLDGLQNLSDQERYMLVKEIINRFQNQEQASRLDLLIVAPDSKHNNIECHICSQALLCKHYLYGLELIESSENGRLDDKVLQSAYGDIIGGTYYCRGCGAPLGNTEVLDVEEFDKEGGKEGMHVKTRDVMDDITIIERQKIAVDKIITDALNDDTNDDLKHKLRIYKLAKDLLGLYVMSVEDELEMVNFLKTYDFIPRKTFYNLIYIKFVKARGGVTSGINKSAIDTLATDQFWRHCICDILGHLLIIIQTSVQTYTVFNKLCVTNNYMGWPLLSNKYMSTGGSGAAATNNNNNIPEEDQGGIELMFCIIKQIAILPEFKSLGGVDGTDINNLRNLLVKRIDEQIRNNEIVRNRLDRALDTKFTQISLSEEFRLNATNFWSSYRPVMVGTIPGGVKWTPARDLNMSTIQDWFKTSQSGAHLSAKGYTAMIAAGYDNIAYQAQLLSHNLTSVIEKETPANRIMLVNTVANSCCPIDYFILSKSSGVPIDKANNDSNDRNDRNDRSTSRNMGVSLNNINIEINYYMMLEREYDPIRNALRRIDEYSKMLKVLERSVAAPRIRITFPYVTKDIKPKDMVLTLEGDDLRAYFLKFIDSGPFKGNEHVFDNFGRCIVSGALKNDVINVNYALSDFEKLLLIVERQKIIKSTKIYSNQPSGVVNLPLGTHDVFVRVLAAIEQNNKSDIGKFINLEQMVEMSPRVTELLEHNCVFNYELENLAKDFTLLAKITNILTLNNISVSSSTGVGTGVGNGVGTSDKKYNKRVSHLSMIIRQMGKLAITRLNELMVAYLGWGFVEFGAGNKESNRVKTGGGGGNNPSGVIKHGLPMDYKKEYYGLITMIDSERQREITDIVDTIGGNKKEELGIEQTLINVGALKDISRDLREFMDRQERIVPHYEYMNHDREQEIQHHIIRADFVRKLIYDVRTLVVQIKNEAWVDYKTAADVSDYLREFYKYKDAARLFNTKLAKLTLLLSNVANQLDEINESSIFGAEVVVGLLAYIFVLILGCMISQVADSHSQQIVKMTVPYDNHNMAHNKVSNFNNDNEFNFMTNGNKNKINDDSNMLGDADSDKDSDKDNDMDSDKDNDMDSDKDSDKDGDVDDDIELYPEFIAESDTNEPISSHDEFLESTDINLGAAAKEVKTTQRKLVINFVKDVVLYAQHMEHVYNEMNMDRIREQIARTLEKQTKLNLSAPKFLKQEGMEDDYRMVMNLINLKFMKYNELNDYVQSHYGNDVFNQDGNDMIYQGEEDAYNRREFDGGDDYGDGDADDAGAIRDNEAHRNKYGLDNAEIAEMGYIGAQEDMEEMDYGYMGVDES